MREAVFLRLNEARWKQYETSAATGPEELAARFVTLTDDLAYAQTFYPGSPTTRYLNDLAAKQHQAIYKNKTQQTGRFKQFWAQELPLLVARHHVPLVWALLLFTVFTLVGALSAAYDDSFVRVVLGDTYVNKTLENIEKGDPMAVYKGTSETPMFLLITINNIYVSLMAYALGATFGLGTVWALFRNGIMLGSFQYFFFQKGVLLPSLLTIWIHGTLEISAIVLAGGAGFVMARGLLFPGTYSRTAAFRQAARDGLKLAIGLVPIFMVAGFLEGFVTRHTEMPMALSLSIIGASAAFIVWYFILYPRYLTRRLALASDASAPEGIVGSE